MRTIDASRRDRSGLVIASRSHLILRGLEDLITGIPELLLQGVAHDPGSAYAAIQKHRPDVIVIDTDVAGPMHRLMRPDSHRARLIMIGAARHPGTLPAGRSDSLCGYLRACATAEQIIAALRTAARCKNPSAGPHDCRDCPMQLSKRLPDLPLTEREYDVFVRIGNGQRSCDIAAALGISVKTIETYREHIKRKLDLGSAHELLAAALGWQSGDYALDA